MKLFMAATMVIMAMLIIAKPGAEAFTCQQVDATLLPCITYLTNGGNPSAACCEGVNNLKNMVPTTADRRAACNCVKEAASRYQNIKEEAAAALPSKCGVQIYVPISRTVDCNGIS